MPKPILKKQPAEIFGNAYIEGSQKMICDIKQQYCGFIKGTCVKPRKSEPDIKVGICSLGYNIKNNTEFEPVIVCPQRFKVSTVFDTIRKKYLSHWSNIEWITEVNMGAGGSVDFVATTKNISGEIVDFLCIEIQAAGTTGTPYQAIIDIKNAESYQSESYPFGINWANEFSKTMMQQAYKKGRVVHHWERKIVFVLQDVGLQYLQNSCDATGLKPPTQDMPVDFCTFKMGWCESTDAWELIFDKIVSTDIEGINSMLGGAAPEMYLTEEEFIVNIIKKGIADRVLDNSYRRFL